MSVRIGLDELHEGHLVYKILWENLIGWVVCVELFTMMLEQLNR